MRQLKLCIGLAISGLTFPVVGENSAGDYLNSLSISTAPDSPWEVTGAASLGMARGNADTSTYSLQILATYENGNDEGFMGADWLYSESNGVKATDSFRVFGQYNRLLNDRLYAGVNGSYLTDDIADIDYRIDLGFGLGYYLIKDEQTSLAFEVGPGMAWEKQGGESRDFVTIRFLERFEHQLSQRSKIWQTAIFAPKVNDFGDYLLTAEAGIDTLLSRKWALRTSLRYQYDSTPAAGRQSDDVALLMGLSYSLGGFPDPAKKGRQTLKPGAAAPEAIVMGWSSSAALGFSLAKGNSDSLTVGLSFDSAYREDAREFFFAGNYNYAETMGNRSSDSVRFTTQYNRLLNSRTFIGTGVGFLRDEVADIDYRVTPSATIGHYLVKNDEMTLSFEAGPGYTFEKAGGVSDDYFSIVAAGKFAWEVSDRVTFKQSLSGIFDPSDGKNYTLLAEAFLDTDITSNLSWRLAAGWAYDNEPAAGREKEDTTLTTGIAVKF